MRIPWQLKLTAKVGLSKIPASYQFWRRVQLFKHGAMEDPAYALGVFQQHFNRTCQAKGFVALELGPGDSLLGGLAARAFGAARYFAVDTGRYVADNLAGYHAMARRLESMGRQPPPLEACQSLDDVLSAINGQYGVDGLTSLREVPDQCVDFLWSHAVLEHVRAHEFDDTMVELHRILKPDGVASHRVDLTDHLGGGLNNLRFSDELWEANWMAASGFYTNRLRMRDMMAAFDRADLDAEVLRVDRWDTLPIERHKLNEAFRALPADELTVSGFDVLLRPR